MDSQSPSAQTPQSFFAGVISRLRSRESMFIGLVFVLAFIVRATLMRFELIFEFDTYFHARMVSYILQGLPVPAIDPLAYYQNVAAATIPNPPWLFWELSAILYKIFTLNSAYSLEKWILVLKILPALYGALICVAMYYLGKTLFHHLGKERSMTAGLFAGVFAAVVPSFVYRTMGGFFEPDALGFIWTVIGFVFFARAIRNPEMKRENIINAVLAALSFSLMVYTWQGFNLLVIFILAIGVMQFLLFLREAEWEKAKHYAQLWTIATLPLAISATFQTGTFWLSQLQSVLAGAFLRNSELGWPVAVLALGIIFGFLALLWWVGKNQKVDERVVKAVYVLGTIFLLALPLLIMVFNISLQTHDLLGQSVGEESPGHNFFGNKYSLMFLYFVAGLPIMGYLLVKKAREHAYLVFPLVWVVVTFFMAWGKLKYTYYMGLPLALVGAVVFVFALEWMKNRSLTNQKIIAVILGFFILGSVAAGIIFVVQNTPNIESTPEWKTALFWSAQNLPADTKFFNWWDEGHWISFLTGRKTLIDNRNADTKTTGKVAEFIVSSDLASAWKIVDDLGSTHLIFGDDLLQKFPSMAFFAYNTQSANDPRIQGLFGAVLPCSTSIAPVTKEKSFTCGSNTFTQAQMNAYPTSWQSKPNTLQSGIPFYVYRSSDNQKLYAFTEKGNQTMLVRLWFDEPNATAAFTPVYANSGVKIFQKNPLPALVDINASGSASSTTTN